jgi:hypothetical protein
MRKYIVQQTYDDFVYPNNNVAIYDVNDVVQNINSNVVSGTVTNFVATLVAGNLKIDFNYTWAKNGAEVFTNQAGTINVLSLHVMPAGVTYFKPWRCVDNLTAVSGSTAASGVYSETFSASTLAVPSLTSGIYYFEIRMIGALQNYIITQQYTVAPGSSPSPTPTRTMTPTVSVSSSPGSSVSPTPTMTMTPTRTLTPTPTKTPGLTPSLSPTPVYYPFSISAGYSTSTLACLDSTPVTTIYGGTGGFLSNSVFYSNSGLTTPYAGGGFYYNNTATNQYVQIDNSGNNTGGGTC